MDADGTPLAILFADISGSTSLYEKLGNSQALRMVNDCFGSMRTALETHHGTLVKTIGDEIIARFDSADHALQAASAMQVALRARAADAPQLGVKIGFTYGPVIQENADVFGDTVNLASRMVAMANPGQILTTRHAVEVLTPFLRSTCRNLYTTNVKGKTEKIVVFEVMWHQDKGITVVGGPGEMEPGKPVTAKFSYRGKEWTLDEARDAVTAGRDPVSDILVAGDKVSRNHARIFTRQGKYVLVDQSANGTFVKRENREILLQREEYILTGHGQIGLGQSVLDSGEEIITYEVA